MTDVFDDYPEDEPEKEDSFAIQEMYVELWKCNKCDKSNYTENRIIVYDMTTVSENVDESSYSVDISDTLGGILESDDEYIGSVLSRTCNICGNSTDEDVDAFELLEGDPDRMDLIYEDSDDE